MSSDFGGELFLAYVAEARGDAGVAWAEILADLEQLRRPRLSPELMRRQRMGQEAYERAMVTRGMAPARARIYASGCHLFRGLG